MPDTIAAIATGASVSAIGIIRLSGSESVAIAERLFRPLHGAPMSAREDRRLIYGELHDREGRLLDLCLCTKSCAPHSYTGEDTVEFQCHGSPVVLRAALDEIFACGARQALAGEFTKRAFVNGCMELTSAEAVVDIIDAETIESARNAAGQLSGTIADKTERIYSALVDMASHFHAVLDYPDEDIEDFRVAAYVGILQSARDELQALLSTFSHGRIMNSGIPTAIIGRPNAGKSSLMNRLLGYERAIVTDVPGTTRDTIEEKVRLGSLCLRLTDTAGIRRTDDAVEQLGVARSLQALQSASLVIAVIDGSNSLDPEDQQILDYAAKAEKAVVVLSKKDLGENFVLPETSLTVVNISSVTGEGIDALESVICSLFPVPNAPSGEILTNARQAEAVSRALESLNAALDAFSLGLTPDLILTELEGTMQALGELSGRTVKEDVTNRIFSRFCVGK